MVPSSSDPNSGFTPRSTCRLASAAAAGPVAHLDAGQDPALPDQIDEGGPVVRFLVQSLVEEDDAADGRHPLGRAGEQQLPVLPSVLI